MVCLFCGKVGSSCLKIGHESFERDACCLGYLELIAFVTVGHLVQGWHLACLPFESEKLPQGEHDWACPGCCLVKYLKLKALNA